MHGVCATSALCACSHTQTARLNRATEEVDKLRAQLSKEQAAHKVGQREPRCAGSLGDLCACVRVQEQLDVYRHTVERLSAEIKRLNKHKAELMLGYKKQLQLIDVLKKQKVHTHASTCTGTDMGPDPSRGSQTARIY